MYYYLWQDDARNKSAAEKIKGGVRAFIEKFHTEPTIILVNEAEIVDIPGITIEVGATVLRGCFWLGPAPVGV